MKAATILYLRKQLALTQLELATLLLVRCETVSRWERDLGHPHAAHQARLRELVASLNGKHQSSDLAAAEEVSIMKGPH